MNLTTAAPGGTVGNAESIPSRLWRPGRAQRRWSWRLEDDATSERWHALQGAGGIKMFLNLE
eukprot:6202899-Pleurochrysis_carterae.AAC.1